MTRSLAIGVRLLLALVAIAIAGCGHDVKPTGNFQNPENIPICCTTDFSENCCALDGFASILGIQISWFSEDGVFAFIDGWIVYRAQGESTPADGNYVRLNPAIILDRSFLDQSVEEGETYWYRLTSITPSGLESLPTAPVSIRTDFSPPDPPTGLVAVAESTRVSLTWNASVEPDFDHYNVLREPPFPPSVFFSVGVNSFLDIDVERGMTYTYRLTAVDRSLNESAASDSVTVEIP